MQSDRCVEFDKVEKSYDGREAVVESLAARQGSPRQGERAQVKS
ncbi:hypothetical protein [Mesorhizobium sp.]|nr:hypothetical protein [Mesorhizobium sp.]